MTARLAVLLPVHNTGEYLRQAVDSVLGQSFTDFTLLLMDDGSTDAETLRIMAEYEHTPRVRMLRNTTNKGLATTLNISLDAALADPACQYVARMDANDICHPERFARQVAFLQEHPDVDVAGSAYLSFHQGQERMAVRKHAPTTREQVMVRLLFQPPFAHPTVIFRASSLRRTPARYDESLPCTQDYDFWARLLLDHAFHGQNIDEPLLRYRRHPQSMGQRLQKRKKQIADNVRSRALKALGFSPSREELRLHNALARGDLPKTIEHVHAGVHWLERMRSGAAPDRSRSLPPLNSLVLNAELDAQLLLVCDNATTLGPLVWRLWRRNAASPHRGGLRLFAKCLLHWDNDRAKENGLRKRLKDAVRRIAAGRSA